jgi:malate synthase
MNQSVLESSIDFKGFEINDYQDIITNESVVFLVELHKKFNQKRLQLLIDREIDQAFFDLGNSPSFPAETKHIRESNWVCAKLPEDLLDRRVEITGPVERKMIINALNSGAKTFMADFEDSNSPKIENVLEGQINLKDAVNKTISFFDSKKIKHILYKTKLLRYLLDLEVGI